MKRSSFEDLVVWQKSMDLVEVTYSLIDKLPSYERNALKDQMRRSVTSIPSNIAEGQQRESAKEFTYFLSIAKGSAGELFTQISICERLGYLQENEIKQAIDLIKQIKKMIETLAITINNK